MLFVPIKHGSTTFKTMIKVVGLDPSLRNWGIAVGTLDLPTSVIDIHTLAVTNPVLPTGKQVRQNSKDLESARQLALGIQEHLYGAQAVFIEVPVGSQSARAMASYGICVGILGGIRAQGIPFFEVTPNEVKLITGNGKQATKRQMIQWAYDRHPAAPWPFQTKKGHTSVVESKAEHMADAVAAIHAGIASNEFQQIRPFLETPISLKSWSLDQ